MRASTTDMSIYVAWAQTVCLSVGHNGERCKNGWTNRLEADSRGPKKLYVLNRGTYGRHLANTMERSVLAGDASCRCRYCSNLLVFLPRELIARYRPMLSSCACLSDIRRYCVKTAKLGITQIMQCDNPAILVFCCQRSRRNSNGDTTNGGAKICKWGRLKSVTFDK